MNHVFKVVFSKTLGIWMVTSELARGSGKPARKRNKGLVLISIATGLSLPGLASAADCFSEQLPFSGGATQGVYGCYISGALQNNDNSGVVEGVDSNNSASYKQKNQQFNEDTVFSLNNDVQWLPNPNGPTAILPVSRVSASELYAKGALTVKDNEGNVLTSLPEFEDWNLNATGGMTQITWTKTDGTQGFADVYVTGNLEVTKNIDTATNFSAQIITAQPTQPFINLTLATESGGTMKLVSDGVQNADGFAIDWSPGQVKQSSLFVAQSGGVIEQAADTPIRVTFSYTDGVNNPSESTPPSGTFGPTKVLSGASLVFQGNTYTLDSPEALAQYNQALIAAIRNNTLTASDYDTEFRKAFSDGVSQYTYTYDPSKVDYTDYFISPEMAAATGKRSIFEAADTGIVNLNANVAAIGQTWARAYNAWAHDGGTINNIGTVTVDNPNTQNALIESGAKFNNSGNVNFAVNGTNWADQVTGTGSTYTNNASGVISVATSTKNNPNTLYPNRYYKSSRAIATEVLNGASAINEGNYFIGSNEPDGSVGTATGVHITNSGSFTNSYIMTIGKDQAGNAISLKGGSAAETLNVDDAYNAVSAYVNNSGSAINIINGSAGTININSSAKNSVAINIGEDPVLTNDSESVFVPQNVTVLNQGTLNVDGTNSAGLKAAGAFTAGNSDSIMNTGLINVTGAGSSGIFASSGAEIVNNGDIVVTGSRSGDNRNYGIRADNATVTLENNSSLTVQGGDTTGLYARTGGQIVVNGGSIDTPEDPSATNQVVFWVSGKNAQGDSSAIQFSSPTSFTLANGASTLFRIDQGASYDGSSSNLKTVNVNGSGSNGYTIATKGTRFTSGGSTINVAGDNATGINVNSGAGTDGNVELGNDTNITVSGNGATIATVDGNTYDLSGNKVGQDGAKLITEAQLSGADSGGQVADNATGYRVINKGELVQNGSIDFGSASNTTGVYIDGGTLTNNGAVISDGIGIDVYQTGKDTSVVNNSSDITAVDGTAAIRLNNQASLTLGGSGTVTGNNAADAVRVMSGASLATRNAQIAVNGSGSGIHFLNTADDAQGGPFQLAGSGQITVTGNEAAGLTLEGQDSAGNPAMSDADMDTRGSEQLVINVNDRGGNGIVTNTSGYVYSGTSVNIDSASGQSALVIRGTTSDIKQTGNLSSNSTTSAVVDLTGLTTSTPVTFINSGNILANGGSPALDASSLNETFSFKNTVSGNIKGTVVLGRGDNTIALDQSSITADLTTGSGNNTIVIKDAASITGALTAGDGSNTVTLQDNSQTHSLALGGGNNVITVGNAARVEGTVSAGDGANTVTLQDTSQTNALTLGNGGNNVNIYGGTTNGTLLSGSGNDNYTLYAVNQNNAAPSQSAGAFSTIDAGEGIDALNVTQSSWYTLSDPDIIRGFENLNLTDNSTFEVHNVDLRLNNSGTDTGMVSVDKDSTYFINFDQTEASYLLTQNIKGDGTIRTDTHGYAFDFNNPDYTRDNFNGTLALGNGTLSILGNNTTALTNATLQLDSGGTAILLKGQPEQTIGGLTFNSGTLFLQEDFIGSQESSLQSHMHVTDLDVGGSGVVHLVANGFDNDYNSDAQLKNLSRKSLLSQDEGSILVTLVRATGNVVGRAVDIALNLTDPNNNVLPGSEEQQQDIRQDNTTVATGTYGLGTTVGGNSDGLYAVYQLKQIDVLKGFTVNLETSSGDTGNALDLSANITGSGGIKVNALGDYLSLSNGHNDYTGVTNVNNGRFVLGDSLVLGQADRHTSLLNMLTGTRVQFGNTTQYAGQINTNQGSSLNLDSGVLNIDNGGVVNGSITSGTAAGLNVNGGLLTVNGANVDYHGVTTVARSATTNIQNVAGLGDGAVNLSGIVNIIKAQAGNLVNTLSDAGQLNVLSGSDVNVTGNNLAFSGSFNIDASSTMRAATSQNLGDKETEVVSLSSAFASETAVIPAVHNEGALYLTNAQSQTWTVNNVIDGGGSLYKAGTGTLALTQDASQYTGQTYITEGALTAGNQNMPVSLATSALNIAQSTVFGGYGSVAGDVNNQGTFNVGGLDKASQTMATTYRVKGNFINAGSVVLGSAAGSGSTLQIGGNYVSNGGELHLNTVLNKGFAETQTDQMQVGGNVTRSSGATRIYVKNVGGQGAYTQPDAIKLIDVTGTSDRRAFVLGQPTVAGPYEYLLSMGTKDNSWYLSSFNPVYPPLENRGRSTLHYINPMIGAFAANQNALSLFNMTLHDRLGEPGYADSLRADGDPSRSLWLRIVGKHQRYNAINGLLSLNGHSTVVQLGHDIVRWNDEGTWQGRSGIMGGVGNQQFTSKSRRTGSASHANIDTAYSLGLYGTWYQNGAGDNPPGTYIDTWGMYNWYRNNVRMSGYSDTRYQSRGYNLSVEVGHTLSFAKSTDTQNQWQLTPQVQAIYGALSTNAAGNDSGLSIGKTQSRSLESRLGARLAYVDNLSKDSQIKPFTEVNWHRQYRDNTLTLNNNYSFNNQQPKSRYELKVGVEGKSSKNWNGWANASYTVGDNAYREPGIMVGMKYQW